MKSPPLRGIGEKMCEARGEIKDFTMFRFPDLGDRPYPSRWERCFGK